MDREMIMMIVSLSIQYAEFFSWSSTVKVSVNPFPVHSFVLHYTEWAGKEFTGRPSFEHVEELA